MWNSFSATRNVRSIPVLPALTGLMLLAWPFLIGFGLANNSLHGILPVMALVLLMRVCQARRQGGPLRYLFVSVALAGIALCAASYVLHAHQWVLLYPVVVNLVMLVVFGGSLWTLWNGMIAYLLMGTLMAGEWLVRQRVKKNDA
ncbi:TPA: hypothetical protein ACRR6V_001885 [Enterobacter hormaechei]